MYRRTPIMMTDLLSPQIMKAKRQWNNILKVLWENSANLSYPLKRSFKNETEIKKFYRIENQKNSSPTDPH